MPKTIYLTIDDFPSATSGKLLEVLEEKGIPAAFFCIGKNLQQYPQVALEAIRRGYTLGNHSFSHPHFSNISLHKAKKEILKTDNLLNVLYAEAGVERMKKIFRFPYGDKGDGRSGRVLTHDSIPKLRLRKRAIQQYLQELGYESFNPPGIKYHYYSKYLGHENDIHWTVDSLDWKLKYAAEPEQQSLINEIVDTLFKSNPPDPRGPVKEPKYGLSFSGSDEILLMHDHPASIGFVELLLTELLNRGMTFRSFY